MLNLIIIIVVVVSFELSASYCILVRLEQLKTLDTDLIIFDY